MRIHTKILSFHKKHNASDLGIIRLSTNLTFICWIKQFKNSRVKFEYDLSWMIFIEKN